MPNSTLLALAKWFQREMLCAGCGRARSDNNRLLSTGPNLYICERCVTGPVFPLFNQDKDRHCIVSNGDKVHRPFFMIGRAVICESCLNEVRAVLAAPMTQ